MDKFWVFKYIEGDHIRVLNVDNEYDAKKHRHNLNFYEMKNDELNVFKGQLNHAGSPHRTEVAGDALETSIVSHSVEDDEGIFSRNQEKYAKNSQNVIKENVCFSVRVGLFFSVIEWPILSLAMCSAIAIIILEFTSFRLPVLIVGEADNVNNFIINISYSIMAATIFYIFCNMIGQYREKYLLKTLAAKDLQMLLEDTARTVKLFAIETDVVFHSKFPNQEELKTILEKVSPDDKSRQAQFVGNGISHLTALEGFASMVHSTTNDGSKMLNYLYLFSDKDHELLRLLENLRRSAAYRLSCSLIPTESFRHYDNLGFLYHYLGPFLETVSQLENLYNRKYQKFWLRNVG